MVYLYNITISILRLLYWIGSLVNPKASLFIKGRKNIFKNIKTALANNTQPVLWVHCASLGEFEQGRPVMEQFKNEFPSYKILLTFFSPSGFEVRKDYNKADFVFYLPWDTRKNAVRFIELTKPALAIFIKYEFWFHYTNKLRAQNIPILSVSSIFRNNQLFFKSYGGFYRGILKNFDHFFVQNYESVKLLNSLGIQECTRAGDTRLDRVVEMVKKAEEIIPVRQFKNNEKVLVVGSCWQEDLDVLIPFINENYYNIKFIIAPHELSESFISNIEKSLKSENIRYSKIEGQKLEDYRVLIIDNIGMLGRLYKYGEFAYIGGAFGKGLHNILEAACYGIPVFFGNKNYQKFQEAVDLINRGGAFAVGDYLDFKHKYEMITLPQTFLLACEVTKQYVEENLGATEKVMMHCRKILSA